MRSFLLGLIRRTNTCKPNNHQVLTKHREEIKMQKIRFWRHERGLTQFDLQNASGGKISRWAIQLIEQGLRVPSATELQILSEVLGIEKNVLSPDQRDADLGEGKKND